MKLHVKIIVAALAIAGSAACLIAQDNANDSSRPRSHGPGGPNGHRPPPPPLMAALDANHDGVIDAVEIDNASAALRKLDKNGDGQLTIDEIRPPRPAGANGPEGPHGHRNGQHPSFSADEQDGPPAGNDSQN